jgi:hypothetical protein
MTLRRIINRLRRHRPASYSDFRACTGVNLTEVGYGCFRKTFHIDGFNAVVKFPIESWGISHSRREIRRLQQVMRRKTLRHLVRYAPKMLYADYKRGIVVMEYLSVIGKSMYVPQSLQDAIGRMLEDTFAGSSDTKGGNLGYNARRQLKLLDWGCV